MELDNVTYSGAEIDDPDVVTRLPANLAGLLGQVNRFIQYRGGLHVRGARTEPAWHSLWNAWDGAEAFHRLYPEVRPEDVPFAEDCVGDQFLLRDRQVWRLSGETGEMSSLGVGLGGFFQAIQADPVEYLALQPLLQFQDEGGRLEPGQLLSVYPPFCAAESREGISLRAIPAGERRQFLAHLADQLRTLPDGDNMKFRIND